MKSKLNYFIVLFAISVVIVMCSIAQYKSIPYKTIECGTAFFINNKGYMATAYHVVKNSKDLRVLYKGKLYKASIIAVDTRNDIAIIKTNLKCKYYLSLTSRIKENEPIVTLGFPQPDYYGTNLKESIGTVTTSYFNIIKNHSKTCPGHSGSPIIDNYGNAVGISTQGYLFYIYNNHRCTTEASGPPAKLLIELANKYKLYIDIDNFKVYNSLVTVINKYKDSVLLLYAL
jgi:Trypsin-like peptidase domain